MNDDLMKIKDVYGRMVIISRKDYTNPLRIQLPFYTRKGNRFLDTEKGRLFFRTGRCVSIHRANIAEVLQ